jgi:class 3 adenylate cyclase/DNA-binding transcriptional MerR regulator
MVLSSKQLIKRAGISRATLNNYIALGLLPKPVVKATTSDTGDRAPRLGYFPLTSLETITKINELKRTGLAMSEIAEVLKRENLKTEFDEAETKPVEKQQSVLPDSRLSLTLDKISTPAYLVNSNFELQWANTEAYDQVLNTTGHFSSDITERNLFPIFLQDGAVRKADSFKDILRFHLRIAKLRLSKSALFIINAELGDDDVDALSDLYDESEPEKPGQVLNTQVNLAPRGEPEQWFDIYAMFFREGIFFVYSPIATENDSILSLLARRDVVIRDLLKSRKPYLTPLTVLVADLQDSVRICAELPPEEYFELINDIWGVMEPKIRKYYATHGKHVGDGMVYYFFPQPDCNYIMNAIYCAKEMKEAMIDVDHRWRQRKGWGNELKLNIGLVEGQEWFGTYQTPTHIEFSVLGDTINMAGRLSDFARNGAIWLTKNMIGQLQSKERDKVHFGVRRQERDGGDILVPSVYSRISNLIDLKESKYEKFRDIAMLAVAEVIDIEE